MLPKSLIFYTYFAITQHNLLTYLRSATGETVCVRCICCVLGKVFQTFVSHHLLQVSDGDQGFSLERMSGKRSAGFTIYSSSNQMRIALTTDHSVVDRGWNFTWLESKL